MSVKGKEILSELVAEVKSQGLADLSEDAVIAVINAVFAVGSKYAIAIPNPLIKGLVFSMLEPAKRELLELADKIDGKVG
jgi:hypothetical protein